jgi:hypothetical protein
MNGACRLAVLSAALLVASLLVQDGVLAATAGKATAGNAAPAGRARAQLQWLAQFADQVRAKGHQAQLPPNLSRELGLNSGASPTIVQQIATRVGTTVHAFNVLAAARGQRVLFSYDEATQLTEAFRLRPDGTLERGVSYRSGDASSIMPPVVAGAGYRRELRFWHEYVYGKGFAPPILTVPLAAPPGASPELNPELK